jgi:hypothetical protein
MACVFYMTHASACLGEATNAPVIYSNVLRLEQQGLSSAQAVQETVEGFANGNPPFNAADLAEGAATFIDGANSKQKNAAADSRAPELFARAVLSICLKNIAQ